MVMHALVGEHGNVNQVGCKNAATKVATYLYLNYCKLSREKTFPGMEHKLIAYGPDTPYIL